MDEKTSISMIVLLYKGKKYLKRILRMFEENSMHFKEQWTNSILELVLVNDSPEDDIDVSNIHLNGGRILLINNEQNMGIHRSKIEGLKHANGEFILFLDQDDLISPYYFFEQYQIIGTNDAVICNVDWGDGPRYLEHKLEALDINCYMNGENAIISLGQVLFRKTAIPIDWLDYPLSINGADDFYLIIIMLLRKQKMVEHRKTLYFHVNTGINLSMDFERMTFSVVELFERLELLNLVSNKQVKKVKNNCQIRLQKERELRKYYIKKNGTERFEKTRLLNLFDRWLRNIELNISIDNYINSFGVKNIAVYGAGHLGKRFVYWLKKTNLFIEFFVDLNMKGDVDGIPIVDIQTAKEQENKFDMIVVTPIADTNSIIDNLEKKFKCSIISLESVIYNMPCQILETSYKTDTEIYAVNDSIDKCTVSK